MGKRIYGIRRRIIIILIVIVLLLSTALYLFVNNQETEDYVKFKTLCDITGGEIIDDTCKCGTYDTNPISYEEGITEWYIGCIN